MPELCPNCGGTLPAEDWQELCPRCVIAVSLRAESDRPFEEKSPTEAADPEEASLPRWFGQYELLRVIGSGGMGVVYEARQAGLNRSVALKLTLRKGSSGTFQRFRREAQAAASLRHPNIVAIHEFGEHKGQPFFSMDLVDGVSLADLTRSRPIEPTRAARYVELIAEAVAYAHGQGILHRDLKPSNVLIDSTDQPQILDFGLAKRLNDDTELTRSGGLLGSPSYMAPEQLREHSAVSPATDVYAIGAILYQLLAGRAPFTGADIESTLLQVLDSEPPAPRLLNPGVPIDLETVCLKCLEKKPAQRYDSAHSLAEDLVRFAGGEPTLARPLSVLERAWRWCRRKPTLAILTVISISLLAAVMAVTGVASVRLSRKERLVRHNSYVADMHLAGTELQHGNLGRARALLEPWQPWGRKGTRLEQSESALAGWEWRYFWNQTRGDELFTLGKHESSILSFAFDRKGTHLFSGSFDGEIKLWELASRRQIATTRHDSRVNALILSPDGRQLASGSGDGIIRVWDATNLQKIGELREESAIAALAFSSAEPAQLFAVTFGALSVWEWSAGRRVDRTPLSCWQRAAISPDRELVALGRPNGAIDLWSVQSGASIGSVSGGNDFILPVAFSLDGKLVAGGGFDNSGWVWEVASRRQVAQLRRQEAAISAIAFSPDGSTVATASYDQTICLWNTQDWQCRATLAGQHSALWSVAFSPSGEQIVGGGKDGSIKVWNAFPAARPTTVLEIPRQFEHGPFSSDGARMLTRDAGGQWSLWNLQEAQPGPRPLAVSGDNVCFTDLAGDPYSLMVKEADGSAAIWDPQGERKLRSIRNVPFVGGISSKGRFLSTCNEGSQTTIHDLSVQKEVLRLSWQTNTWYQIQFSPDERYAVACSHEGPLLLCDLVGPVSVKLLTGHRHNVAMVCFSSDGRFFASAGEDGTVRLWDGNTGHSLAVLNSGADAFWSVTVSPDAQRVAAGSGEGTVSVWDAARHDHIATFSGHSGIVGTVAFTPDGNTLISAAKDAVRFWRAASWAEVMTETDRK